MVANHEYTDEILMFRGYDPANPTREQVEIAWAAHGLSVVVVQEEHRTGKLGPVNRHPLNRRLTATSEFRMTGPAAGSTLLRTSADRTGRKVLGTSTTVRAAPPRGAPRCTARRTSTSTSPTAPPPCTSGTGSARVAPSASGSGSTGGSTWRRSPTRPTASAGSSNSTRTTRLHPRKRTALGRFRHEAAQPRLTSDGRPVVCTGDDEKFDYLYKFVSSKRMKKGNSRAAREHNLTLLDEGTLYVAKLTGDSPVNEVDGTGKLPNDGEFDGSGV